MFDAIGHLRFSAREQAEFPSLGLLTSDEWPTTAVHCFVISQKAASHFRTISSLIDASWHLKRVALASNDDTVGHVIADNIDEMALWCEKCENTASVAIDGVSWSTLGLAVAFASRRIINMLILRGDGAAAIDVLCAAVQSGDLGLIRLMDSYLPADADRSRALLVAILLCYPDVGQFLARKSKQRGCYYWLDELQGPTSVAFASAFHFLAMAGVRLNERGLRLGEGPVVVSEKWNKVVRDGDEVGARLMAIVGAPVSRLCDALQSAVARGASLGLIRVLLEAGAFPDGREASELFPRLLDRPPPLHYAIVAARADVVDVLLQYGADVNLRTTKEPNLFTQAMRKLVSGRGGVLMDRVDVMAGDGRAWTPLDVVRDQMRRRRSSRDVLKTIERVLIRHGAR
jgi:hypothetical protein